MVEEVCSSEPYNEIFKKRKKKGRKEFELGKGKEIPNLY